MFLEHSVVRNNFKNKEKSIGTMERLKAFSVEKFTLDGRKVHILTILSAKYMCQCGDD